MKTFKRILAVLLLLIAIFAISYSVYTAKQIAQEVKFTEEIYEVAKKD